MKIKADYFFSFSLRVEIIGHNENAVRRVLQRQPLVSA